MEFPGLVFFVAHPLAPHRLFVFLAAQPGGPIIVDITEPPKSELSTLSQVLLGSLGLSGFLALMAITLGIALGGLMFWIKRRRSAN
jgi:hypothetical protein